MRKAPIMRQSKTQQAFRQSSLCSKRSLDLSTCFIKKSQIIFLVLKDYLRSKYFLLTFV